MPDVRAAAQLEVVTAAWLGAGLPLDRARDLVPEATLDDIAGALAAAPVDILHILCHGFVDPRGGALCLRHPDGGVAYVDGATLAQRLVDTAVPRLVVLTACHSGDAVAGQRLGSVGLELQRTAGVEAVIASRFPLSIAGGGRLAARFYGTLLSEPASVETAFLAARSHLRIGGEGNLDATALQLLAHPSDGDDTRPVVFAAFGAGSLDHLAHAAPADFAAAVRWRAERVGLRFEEGLLERLVVDFEQDRALPLLQALLRQLWTERQGAVLTNAAYERIGGVAGAVAAPAEALYTSLDPADRTRSWLMLDRLVDVEDDEAPAGRTASLEIVRGLDPGLGPVIARWLDAHVVREEEGRLSLAHEALIAGWPRLCERLVEQRPALVALHAVREAAERWHGGGGLWEGPEAEAAAAAVTASGGRLTTLELSFVHASVAATAAVRQARRASDAARSAARPAHRERVLWGAGAALLALCLAEGAWRAGPLRAVDTLGHDLLLIAAGDRQAASDVVLVPIDAESLARNPDPLAFWGPDLASAIDSLDELGATAVDLDLLIRVDAEAFFRRHAAVVPREFLSWDNALRGQIYAGKAVLVAELDPQPKGALLLRLPIGAEPQIMQQPQLQLGIGNLAADRHDRVLRDFQSVWPLGDSAPTRLSFGLALALRHLGISEPDGPWQLPGGELRDDDPVRPIQWSGPPGSLPELPFWKLLEPRALTRADRELVSGKVALIGQVGGGSRDVFPTPYSRLGLGRDMAGVEVHAQIVNSLLDARRVRPLRATGRVIGSVAAAIGGVAVGLLWGVRRGAAAFVAVALAVGAAGVTWLVAADRTLPAWTWLAAFAVAAVLASIHHQLVGDEERSRLRDALRLWRRADR